MSSNIIKWNTKGIDSLKIPVQSLYKNARKDWHPKEIRREDGASEFTIAETVSLSGNVADGILCVNSIECSGEGSGTGLSWIIAPALEDSTGELVATFVCEDGTIERMTASGGNVTFEEISI